MVASTKKRNKGGLLRRFNIIEAILKSDLQGVQRAIEEDAYCVNSIHEPSGMNAPMLAAAGRLPTFLEEILRVGSVVDFAHQSKGGHDLLGAAMMSSDPEIIEQAQSALEQFAPHIINNWPEP